MSVKQTTQQIDVQLVITKDGTPALWETGGMNKAGYGTAWIVTDKKFGPKHAIYIRQWGHLENAHHALIPVEEGDYLISASTRPSGESIVIYRLSNFKTESDGELCATGTPVAWYKNGEWEGIKDFDTTLADQAADAALMKARCIKCVYPHYIKEPVVR